MSNLKVGESVMVPWRGGMIDGIVQYTTVNSVDVMLSLTGTTVMVHKSCVEHVPCSRRGVKSEPRLEYGHYDKIKCYRIDARAKTDLDGSWCLQRFDEDSLLCVRPEAHEGHCFDPYMAQEGVWFRSVVDALLVDNLKKAQESVQMVCDSLSWAESDRISAVAFIASTLTPDSGMPPLFKRLNKQLADQFHKLERDVVGLLDEAGQPIPRCERACRGYRCDGRAGHGPNHHHVVGGADHRKNVEVLRWRDADETLEEAIKCEARRTPRGMTEREWLVKLIGLSERHGGTQSTASCLRHQAGELRTWAERAGR